MPFPAISRCLRTRSPGAVSQAPGPALALVAVLAGGSLAGCGHPATANECDELFAKSAEIELRAQRITDPKVIQEKTAAARAAEPGVAFASHCVGRRITTQRPRLRAQGHDGRAARPLPVSGSRTAARRDVLATLAIIGTLVAVLGGPSARRAASRRTRRRIAARPCSSATRTRRRARGSAPPRGSACRSTHPTWRACTRDLTDAEVACALKSGYADELERCLP